MLRGRLLGFSLTGVYMRSVRLKRAHSYRIRLIASSEVPRIGGAGVFEGHL